MKYHAKMVWILLVAASLSGCLTMSGVYDVTVVDAEGKNLTPNQKWGAQGHHVYSVRNALCSTFPGATVHIRDSETKEELRSESPYQCRSK